MKVSKLCELANKLAVEGYADYDIIVYSDEGVWKPFNGEAIIDTKVKQCTLQYTAKEPAFETLLNATKGRYKKIRVEKDNF